MTTIDILWACVGFILCTVIFIVIFLVILVAVSWTLKADQNVEIDFEESEEE